MIYSREYESMPTEEREQLQFERLQAILNRVYRNVSFYKNRFDQEKIDPTDVKSMDDFRKIPFTTKDDLQKSYPYEAFAVPLRDIVRIHSTSGTTGVPIVVGYTRNDIDIWSSLTARALAAAGVSGHDFVQITFPYSQSTGGFGFHYGAEKLGASVIPVSGEPIEKQIRIMKDYRTTTLVSTPGYALHLASVLDDMGMDAQELNLSIGVFGSEPWSEHLREEIQTRLKIKAYDNYGLSEIIGPGVAFECGEVNGMHVNEDHFIVEVIDPDKGKPVKDGETGELVFTTITKQGFPLIRYRTGDISALVPGMCSCGRTTRRIARISGRTDDMIILEGTNIFPSQIESLLCEIEGAEPHFRIIMRRSDGVDSCELKLEVSRNFLDIDEMKRMKKFQDEIQSQLLSRLGLQAKVTLVEPKTLSRSSGAKLTRVVDERFSYSEE